MRRTDSRTLSDDESLRIIKALSEKWNFSFDASQKLMNHPVLTIEKKRLSETHYQQIVQLVSLYTSTVFEIHPNKKVSAFPAESFHPDVFETVFCDDTFGWVMYAGGDGSLAFGGGWLIDYVSRMISSLAAVDPVKTKKSRKR